jgi:hypothetical protein
MNEKRKTSENNNNYNNHYLRRESKDYIRRKVNSRIGSNNQASSFNCSGELIFL